MAIAALLLWMCTAAIGSYLLIAAARTGHAEPADEETVSVPAQLPGSEPRAGEPVPVPAQVPGHEQVPVMRALAEFAHPALAVTGFGFWFCYVLSRDPLFAAIGLGVLLGAICAGLTWYLASARAARRDAVTGPAGDGAGRPASPPLSFSPRLLLLHAVGAVLTLLLTALIAVRA